MSSCLGLSQGDCITLNHLFMYRFIVLFLLCCSSSVLAQPFQLEVEKSFPPQFFDYFLSADQKDVYLSPDGMRLFINSDLRYQILSASTGDILAEGKHVNKQNAGIASIFGMLKNKSLNREDAIDKARFDEGTEYMVFPEENVILILDWNLDDNILKAIDLESGDVLWETNRYRYSASSASQYVDLMLGMANVGQLRRNRPADIARANARLQGYGTQTGISQDASPAALGFLTPMPGTGLCLFRVQDSHVAIDLKTGEEQWLYDQRKINIGFADMAEDGTLIVVNFHSSFFKSNDRLILKIDPQTGKEIWATEHLSNFRAGRTYLVGDRLVCDYYGAEVFDLENGQRVFLTIDEKIVKRQNAVTTAFMSDATGGRGTASIASPSVVEGNHLYASVFKLGKKRYANDGSSKAIILKYDLQSGDLIWESEKLSVGTNLNFVSKDHVFVRKGKALGKSSLIILDTESGNLLNETASIDGFIYRQGCADILTNDYLFRGGKKNIYAFSSNDWELSKKFDAKASKTGKLQAMIPSDQYLLSIGDKGAAFFDGHGQAQKVIQTPAVHGTYWNQRFCYLFTEKGTYAIDLHSQQEAARLPLVPGEDILFLFSEDGQRLIVFRDQQHLSSYTNLPTP